jgi:glycosyltransferase involved in cell wall biosynthesis
MSLPLSVVIPTYNRAPVLERCLAALRAQALGPGEDFEVIVVDDGSADATLEVVQRALAAPPPGAPLRSLRQTNAGPAAARNRGLALARGDVVLFLGDDVIGDPGLVAAHLQAHRQGGPRTAVLGPIEPGYEGERTPFEAFLDQSGLQFDFRLDGRDPEDLPFAMFYTANVSADRGALVEVGGFDERFRDAAWEDVELSYRLSRTGVRIRFAPAARVLHLHPVTLAQYTRRMRANGRAARLLLTLHPQEEVAAVVAPMVLSEAGYRTGRLRAGLARLAIGAARRAGQERRLAPFLRGLYSIVLHYEFNRTFRAPLPVDASLRLERIPV